MKTIIKIILEAVLALAILFLGLLLFAGFSIGLEYLPQYIGNVGTTLVYLLAIGLVVCVVNDLTKEKK